MISFVYAIAASDFAFFLGYFFFVLMRLSFLNSGKDCDESCDNNRVYVSGLPTTITEGDLVDKFSGIGIIARIRQARYLFSFRSGHGCGGDEAV